MKQQHDKVPETIAEQLRQAVRSSQWSLNAIAKAASIKYPSLHRFVNDGAYIRLESAGRLATLFRMQLTAPIEPNEMDGQRKEEPKR